MNVLSNVLHCNASAVRSVIGIIVQSYAVNCSNINMASSNCYVQAEYSVYVAEYVQMINVLIHLK